MINNDLSAQEDYNEWNLSNCVPVLMLLSFIVFSKVPLKDILLKKLF